MRLETIKAIMTGEILSTIPSSLYQPWSSGDHAFLMELMMDRISPVIITLMVSGLDDGSCSDFVFRSLSDYPMMIPILVVPIILCLDFFGLFEGGHP